MHTDPLPLTHPFLSWIPKGRSYFVDMKKDDEMGGEIDMNGSGENLGDKGAANSNAETS